MLIAKPLPVLLIAAAFVLSGCSEDAPPESSRQAAEQQAENFGGGLGRSYNDMLDQAKQGADQANQQMQDLDQRVRETR